MEYGGLPKHKNGLMYGMPLDSKYPRFFVKCQQPINKSSKIPPRIMDKISILNLVVVGPRAYTKQLWNTREIKKGFTEYECGPHMNYGDCTQLLEAWRGHCKCLISSMQGLQCTFQFIKIQYNFVFGFRNFYQLIRYKYVQVLIYKLPLQPLGPAGAMAMSKWLPLVDLHKNRRITTRVIIETIGKKTSGSIKSNIWFCF